MGGKFCTPVSRETETAFGEGRIFDLYGNANRALNVVTHTSIDKVDFKGWLHLSS